MENPKRFGELLSSALMHAKAATGKSITHLQHDLADSIGRSPHTVEHYKRGRVPPDTRSIYLLVQKLVTMYGLPSSKDVCTILSAAGYPNPELVSHQLIRDRDNAHIEEFVPHVIDDGTRKIVDLSPVFGKYFLPLPKERTAYRVYLTLEATKDVTLH